MFTKQIKLGVESCALFGHQSPSKWSLAWCFRQYILCFLCQRLEMGWSSAFTNLFFADGLKLSNNRYEINWYEMGKGPKKKNQTSFKIYLIATSGRDRTLKWWLREIMNGRTFQISVLWQFIQILEPKFEMSGQPSFVCPSYWRYWGTTTYQDGSKKEGNSLSLTRLGTLWVLVWTTLS